MLRSASLLALVGCGFDIAPSPPVLRPIEDSFVAYRGEGEANDVAVLPGGDIVVVGCEHAEIDFDPAAAPREPRYNFGNRSVFVVRIDRTTRKAVWTRRSSSPCGTADDWSVPRVSAITTAAGVRIWVAAYGWGRGPSYDEERGNAPVTLLAFDGDGGLGAQRELARGQRVRVMTSFGGRIVIAGQAIGADDRSTAFVAALDDSGADTWRTAVPAPHAAFVESIAIDGDHLLVGGHVDSKVDRVDNVVRGRESVGFVHTLRGRDGALVKTWSRRFTNVNVDDVRVAVADGKAFVAYGVSLWAEHAWPAALQPMPAGSFTSFLVEPLADKPAWRRAFTGTTHTSVMGLAATRDRIALVIDAQGGSIDLGRGAWDSKYFNLGGYVEISPATGTTLDARRITASGDEGRVFLRTIIWDGAAFTAVGEVRGKVTAGTSTHDVAEDAPFVWRIGT